MTFDDALFRDTIREHYGSRQYRSRPVLLGLLGLLGRFAPEVQIPWEDYDPLLEEFRELERQVTQRDCQHKGQLAPMNPDRWFCPTCGRTTPR